jgi:hypothetical protein
MARLPWMISFDSPGWHVHQIGQSALREAHGLHVVLDQDDAGWIGGWVVVVIVRVPLDR